MAWSIETYAGNDIYLPGNGGRIGMQQLMLAINEREWAIDRTETVWMLPDGTTEMARPGISDLVGATVGISSTIQTNCARIKSAISGLAGSGKFIESVDSDDVWNMTTLQTEVGASFGASVGPQDDAFLQTAKDILDLLIYVRHEIALVGGEATRYYNDYPVLYPDDGFPDPEGWNAAWAAMITDTVTLPANLYFTSGAPGPGPTWNSITMGRGRGFLDGVDPNSQFATSMITDGVVSADLSDLHGVVTSALLDCQISTYFSGPPAGTPIDFDFAGVTLTQVLGLFTGTKDITPAVPSFNTPYDFSVSVLSDGAPTPDDYRGYVRAFGIIVYGDLTTVLTDQA